MVREAAAELEDLLSRVAVTLVLSDGISNGLLGQTVLQFERGDWQPVDEKAEIERPLGFIEAVSELARHTEAIPRE